MANNIYIGNRYVPIFANPVEWDNLRSYEPLTIVTYQGTSYTSKKTVPVGVALNNTEYWVATGNYNAYIGELEDDIDTINTNITSINSTLSSHTTKINSLYDLHNRVFILIGDSYGQGYTPNVADKKGWCAWVKEMIEAAGGVALISNNYGAGFATPNNTWLTILQNKESDWSDYADKVTDVVFLGGSNDQEGNGVTTLSLQNGIDLTFNYVHAHYPNAKIYTGIFSAVYNQLINNAIGTFSQYDTYATGKGAVFLGDLRLLACNPENIASDNVHLTQFGYQLCSYYIFDCIMTGHCHFAYEYYNDVTFDSTQVAEDCRDVISWYKVTENSVTIEYRDKLTNTLATIKLGNATPESATLKPLFTQNMNIPVGRPGRITGYGDLFSVKVNDGGYTTYHGKAKLIPNDFLWGSTRMRCFYPFAVTNQHQYDTDYIHYLSLAPFTYMPD